MSNLNESIISIRVKLQSSKLKQSGFNKFANFKYFELADFLPRLNELMLEEKVNDRFYIDNDCAVLELVKGDELNTYKVPFIMFPTPLNKNGQPSMQDIQYLGALNTYYKRYLYLNAFGITDGEVIDSMDETTSNTSAKATSRQIDILNQYYIGENMTKLLNANGISKIEDMPFKKATELIKKLKK